MNHAMTESRMPEPSPMPERADSGAAEASDSGPDLQASVGGMEGYPHGGGGMMAMPMPPAAGSPASAPQPYSAIAGQPEAVNMAAKAP
jgi:hypothetical protein